MSCCDAQRGIATAVLPKPNPTRKPCIPMNNTTMGSVVAPELPTSARSWVFGLCACVCLCLSLPLLSLALARRDEGWPPGACATISSRSWSCLVGLQFGSRAVNQKVISVLTDHGYPDPAGLIPTGSSCAVKIQGWSSCLPCVGFSPSD